MIDNSCKFYLLNNDVAYTYCINLVEGHNQTAKAAYKVQRIAYSSSFIPCKNQRKLESWVVFTVNRYECFMENKIMIRALYGCKPSKKNNIECNSDRSLFHLVVLFQLVLNKNIKMETQNILVSTYPLKVSSTQNSRLYSKGSSTFLLSGSWSLVLSPWFSKFEVLPITTTR